MVSKKLTDDKFNELKRLIKNLMWLWKELIKYYIYY
jgi:hypothetical protein